MRKRAPELEYRGERLKAYVDRVGCVPLDGEADIAHEVDEDGVCLGGAWTVAWEQVWWIRGLGASV